MHAAGTRPGHCYACGANVPRGAERCGNCGAPQIDLGPCPHCNGTAGTSPHRELRRVCDLCGGPRIPALGGSKRRRGAETPLLREAEAARRGRALWRGVSIAAGLALPAMLLFFGVLLLFSLKFLFIGLFFMAPVALLLAAALSKAKAKGKAIGPALDGAWIMAATEVARQAGRPITVDDLCGTLGVDETRAEELLAQVEMNDAIGAGPRMRFDAGPRGAGTSDDGSTEDVGEAPPKRRTL